ncbi:hypothetical protein D1B33_12030 [Lysinibacillus yapensis]|uniref:DUF2768 domain-containing protein n=1 Tax=Ureibacillus yapensis TaxID=2304605 RepID=A0A396S9M2_9BACL|nr:hypothetical protein [Lysinibacillus yapensis]RHW35825.1 hypothetical protein D1B33_12030 [Lysinibacillus yapensis]
MLLLLLAIALMTLGLVMFAVGKYTKRIWLKLLGIFVAVVGFLIFVAVVLIFLFFPGAVTL